MDASAATKQRAPYGAADIEPGRAVTDALKVYPETAQGRALGILHSAGNDTAARSLITAITRGLVIPGELGSLFPPRKSAIKAAQKWATTHQNTRSPATGNGSDARS